MVVTWLANWLARRSIDVQRQNEKEIMGGRLVQFRSGMLMEGQCSSIDFKAIMYPTLFAGRVGMISSWRTNSSDAPP